MIAYKITKAEPFAKQRLIKSWQFSSMIDDNREQLVCAES